MHPLAYRLILSLFVLLLIPQTAFPFIEYKITPSFENRNFVLNRDNYHVNDFETLETQLEFTYDNEEKIKLFLHPRFKIDFLNSHRNRYLPLESVVTLYGKTFELSAGLEKISWGTANSFNPTDVINRRDFEDDYYDPEKEGEVIVSFQKTIDQAGPFSELAFWGALLPFFQEAPLPENDSRFSLAGSAGGIPYTLFDDQDELGYPENLGGALKISTTLKNTDLAVHYYHGPNRDPGFFLMIDSEGALRLSPFYYLIDMIGLNTESTIGNWGLHLESALVITSVNDTKPHDIPFEENNAIPTHHLQFVPGVDYTFHDFFGKGELKLTLEYLGEENHETTLRDFRPFKNDLFSGFQYDFNNSRLTHIKMGVIKDLGNREMIGKFEFSSKLVKELKLEVEGVWVIRDSDAQTPLSVIDNNSSVMTRLSYAFGKRF